MKPEPRSLRRRLYSNAAWSVIGRVISIGSVFASVVLLGRHLSTADFSAYTLAAAAVGFLSMPATFGAPRVILRLIREGLATHQPQLAINGWRGCIQLVVGSSMILALAFVVGVSFLEEDAKWRGIRDDSLLVAAWFTLSALCVAVAHALQGFDDFRMSAMVGARSGGIIANVLFLIAIAIALPAGQLTLQFALAAQVALNLLSLAFGWFVLRAAMRAHAGVKPADELNGDASRSGLLWCLRECWPILLIQLTSLGIAQIDVLLVGWLSNESEIATYGAIARLGEILGAAQILATSIAAPFISELYATKQFDKLERLLRGIASLVAAPTLLVALAFMIAPGAILEHTFGYDFTDGAMTLRIVTIGSVVATLTGLNSLTMIMAGQQRQLMWLSAFVSLIYLTLAPLLISRWGIEGAATATALVFGAYNVAVTLMVKRRLGVWTVASFSPASYAFAIRQILHR